MTPLLLIAAGVAMILIGLRLLEQPLARDAITSWHTPIPQVEDDAQTVYARIYQGLKDGLQNRQVELRGMGFGPEFAFLTPGVAGHGFRSSVLGLARLGRTAVR